MATHLELELEYIRRLMFQMADLAIEAITKSVESLKNKDVKLAEKIIQNDNVLDKLEMDIDEECLKVLVTKQPAAVDLRFVLAMIKINTDLERVGDLASNIATETLRLSGQQLMKPLVDIPRMAALAVDMIRGAFQSITERDVELARKIIEMDVQMDELNVQVYRELFSYMAEDARSISQALSLIMVSKALERIGDHATNIAERAVFYIEGIDIRHQEV